MFKKKLFRAVKTFVVVGAVALSVGSVLGGSTIQAKAEEENVTAEYEATINADRGAVVLVEDTWYYMVNGNVDYEYTGLACNDYGWWKISNGTVDFGFTGMACNEYGWWAVTNGSIDFGFTGLRCNEYGWFYFENGMINWNYTGLVCNEYGWWFVTNGAINWNYTGMACNQYGWWAVVNGGIDFGYNGVMSNDIGQWLMTNGTVDWGFTGTKEFNKITYEVSGGAVTSSIDNSHFTIADQMIDAIEKPIPQYMYDYFYSKTNLFTKNMSAEALFKEAASLAYRMHIDDVTLCDEIAGLEYTGIYFRWTDSEPYQYHFLGFTSIAHAIGYEASYEVGEFCNGTVTLVLAYMVVDGVRYYTMDVAQLDYYQEHVDFDLQWDTFMMMTYDEIDQYICQQLNN